MPKKVPLIAVTVFRDGKAKELPVGKPADFTEDEVAEIESMVPGSLRDPIVEVAAASVSADPAPVAKPAAGKKAAKDDGL